MCIRDSRRGGSLQDAPPTPCGAPAAPVCGGARLWAPQQSAGSFNSLMGMPGACAELAQVQAALRQLRAGS
eukprot:2474349-Alexandrium_andersonii.AAC.1